ncbi:hypothetical protein TNCV_4592981 [Trichonephila clavipes]|nr:hypothetical protein TNCV_4592981 [Trichonephila clavipes]
MGIPYHPEIKATVFLMATHILSHQGQSQTNAVKAPDYGNSALGLARCFAGGLYGTRNNNQLRCLLRNYMEAPKSIAKETAWHAAKRCFAPPRQRKASHFLKDSRVNRIFWLGVFGPCTIHPQSFSK